jgi:AraC-like DNA-binding protein
MLIYEHVEQTIDYRALAWNLKLNYTAFLREFHKITGLPHTQYQIELRLNKAKELLCETTLPIREIVEQLGFRDPFHFDRFFKAKTGMTPGEYRQASSGG